MDQAPALDALEHLVKGAQADAQARVERGLQDPGHIGLEAAADRDLALDPGVVDEGPVGLFLRDEGQQALVLDQLVGRAGGAAAGHVAGRRGQRPAQLSQPAYRGGLGRDRPDPQDDVHAGRHRLLQAAPGDQLDAQRRVAPEQLAHVPDELGAGHVRGQGDAHRAPQLLGGRGDVALRRLQHLDEPPGMLRQPLSGRRDPHRARRALDQLHPGPLLDALDTPPHRVHRDPQPPGRRRQALAVNDPDKGTNLVEIFEDVHRSILGRVEGRTNLGLRAPSAGPAGRRGRGRSTPRRPCPPRPGG